MVETQSVVSEKVSVSLEKKHYKQYFLPFRAMKLPMQGTLFEICWVTVYIPKNVDDERHPAPGFGEKIP